MKKFITGKTSEIKFDREFCKMWKLGRDKISKVDNTYNVKLSKFEGWSSWFSSAK